MYPVEDVSGRNLAAVEHLRAVLSGRAGHLSGARQERWSVVHAAQEQEEKGQPEEETA